MSVILSQHFKGIIPVASLEWCGKVCCYGHQYSFVGDSFYFTFVISLFFFSICSLIMIYSDIVLYVSCLVLIFWVWGLVTVLNSGKLSAILFQVLYLPHSLYDFSLRISIRFVPLFFHVSLTMFPYFPWKVLCLLLVIYLDIFKYI